MDVGPITESLRKEIASSRCPGAVVAVKTSGAYDVIALGDAELEPRRAMSPASEFTLGCIVKFLVALITVKLADAGLVDLDESLSVYLEELRGDPKAKAIRLRHLLSHSSGLLGPDMYDPRIYTSYDWETFVRFFRTTKQLFEPGRVLSYEHFSYAIVGEILARHTGSSVDALISRHIFGPLGLSATDAHAQTEPATSKVGGYTRAGGGSEPSAVTVPAYAPFWRASFSDLSLSMPSLVAITDAVCAAASERPAAGLPFTRTVVLGLTRQLVPAPAVPTGAFRETSPVSYGLGCALFRRHLYGHNGGAIGQDCTVRFDPARRTSIAVGMNHFTRVGGRSAAFASRVAELIGYGDESPDAETGSDPDFSPAELAGRYEGPGFSIRIEFEAAGLTCAITHAATGKSFSIPLPVTRLGESVRPLCNDALLLFFREPDTGRPCILWALAAYRKVGGH